MIKLVVYGASWCKFCNDVREELDTAGMSYEYWDIDTAPEARDHAKSVRGTIPLVEMRTPNGEFFEVGGYKETKEKLDFLREAINYP